MKMAAAGREVYAGPQERCLTSVWRRIHEAGDKLFGSWFAEMIGRETAQTRGSRFGHGRPNENGVYGFPTRLKEREPAATEKSSRTLSFKRGTPQVTVGTEDETLVARRKGVVSEARSVRVWLNSCSSLLNPSLITTDNNFQTRY
jgi:hypothetical protein